MLDLGKTLKSFTRHRRGWDKLMQAAAAQRTLPQSSDTPDSHLCEVTDFGSNPGALRMFTHVPKRLAASPALVVVLHGCTQTAASYDRGAGWSTLADRSGFVVLLPEQQPSNNPKNCFTWFQPGDTTRGRGEALSIRQMIEKAILDHGIDPRRVYVTGLSAGGAMTSVMLATYPEVFAAGAIIAGLPYGAAANVQGAFASMQGRTRPSAEWGDFVRGASSHQGPWPKVSVWHGTADVTVNPLNADEIVKQWAAVHGLSVDPTREDRGNGYSRRVWCATTGEELIESYTVAGMAHGTPLATGSAADQCGNAGAFFLDVGISSSYHIAKSWGLVEHAQGAEQITQSVVPRERSQASKEQIRAPLRAGARGRDVQIGPYKVQAMITNALKSAGLIK